MQRLSELETHEISLVPRGANKKKFLVKKSAEELMDKKKLLEQITKADPKAMERIAKVLKDFGDGMTMSVPDMSDMVGKEEQPKADAGAMDSKVQAMLKAIGRIAAPFKGQVPADLIHKVIDAAYGTETGEPQGGEMAGKEASAHMSPEKVSEDHKIEALNVGKAAYKAHMEKLGYKKYPDAEIAQKADDSEDDEEGDMEDKDVEKSDVLKALEGELKTLPKETRKVLSQVFKNHKSLVEKNESLGREVEGLRTREKRREFVTKAESMKHLGIETGELADTLMDLSNKAPEAYAKIEKMLEGATKLNEKSEIFKELGSNIAGNSKTTWDRIESAALGAVEKSGEKVSKAQAVDKFLETTEGKKMYSDYMADHASSK